MASRPEACLPVEVRGALRLDAPTGRSLELMADSNTLRLDLPGWPEARAMIPRSFGTRARTVRQLATVLTSYGLTLSLESAGKPVFRLGCNVRPSWLARLAGLAPARIPLSAIRMLFRR